MLKITEHLHEHTSIADNFVCIFKGYTASNRSVSKMHELYEMSWSVILSEVRRFFFCLWTLASLYFCRYFSLSKELPQSQNKEQLSSPTGALEGKVVIWFIFWPQPQSCQRVTTYNTRHLGASQCRRMGESVSKDIHGFKSLTFAFKAVITNILSPWIWKYISKPKSSKTYMITLWMC